MGLGWKERMCAVCRWMHGKGELGSLFVSVRGEGKKTFLTTGKTTSAGQGYLSHLYTKIGPRRDRGHEKENPKYTIPMHK